MASEKGYDYNYKYGGLGPMARSGLTSPRKRRALTTEELEASMSPTKRRRIEEERTKITTEDKLEYLLNKEKRKLFNDPHIVELAYEINKFVELAQDPPEYFRKKHSKIDPDLLKLAYYLSSDHLLDLVPNEKGLDSDIAKIMLLESPVIDEQDFRYIENRLNNEDDEFIKKRIDETVKIHWPNITIEAQYVMSEILSNLVYKIIKWQRLEELYHQFAILKSEIESEAIEDIMYQGSTGWDGIRLLILFFQKLGTKEGLEVLKLPYDVADLIGGYISRY